MSAKKMREAADLDRLWIRRENACRKFAEKNISNPRCEGWFVPRGVHHYPRRAGAAYRMYSEPISRTDSHRNSPINYARRLLNNS